MRIRIIEDNHTRPWFDITLLALLTVITLIVFMGMLCAGIGLAAYGFVLTSLGLLTSLAGGRTRPVGVQEFCRWSGLMAGIAGLIVIAVDLFIARQRSADAFGALTHAESFVLWFGMVANTVTVVAGLIAIGGVVWAIRGRARMSVASMVSPGLAPYLHLTVASTGAGPLRDVHLVVGTLDSNGFSMRGDTAARRSALTSVDAIQIIGYESTELTFASPARENEYRFIIEQDQGLYLTVQWNSPLFPWRRASRTYVWMPHQRFASEHPSELTGSAEAVFLKRTRDPALDPTLPGYSAPPAGRVNAMVATDDSFEESLRTHVGPVLVAVGAMWQGRWWQDVKRVLDLFAHKHSPKVRVIVVNIDQCPRLAERFEITTFPTFMVFKEQAVVGALEGTRSLPELEQELHPFLA